MHGDSGCPSSNVIAAGDAWLSANLPPIIDFVNAHHGVLFIVWDEPDGGSTLIPFVAIGPHVKSGLRRQRAPTRTARSLKSVEEIFGLPILPTVAGANDFADLFQLPLRLDQGRAPGAAPRPPERAIHPSRSSKGRGKMRGSMDKRDLRRLVAGGRPSGRQGWSGRLALVVVARSADDRAADAGRAGARGVAGRARGPARRRRS